MVLSRRVRVLLVAAIFAVGCGGGSGSDDAGGMLGDGGGGGGTDSGMPGMDAGGGDGGNPGDDGGGDASRPPPTCTDGEQNGTETDTDCGGNECPRCADGLMCTEGMDCASVVCSGGRCAAATCTDGARNQDETDVDCGGATCDACADGEMCATGTDCASGVCDPTMMRCVPAGCADGARNGDETDVDCGGPCGPCGVGRRCETGADCETGYCDAAMTCQTPTCTDRVQNQDETDVDCGGATCTGCTDGERCLIGRDCVSAVCDPTSLLCATPTCSDGIMNAGETGIDCGGAACSPCGTGSGCASGADCASGVCDPATRTCAVATCTDGVQNSSETGIDCGGACAGCPTGGGCTTGADCASGVCTAGVCVAATCTDGVRNGAETAIDCGGGTCPRCPVGGGCSSGADCASGVCDPATMTCSTPGCTDGVQNGDELAIDCGGGTCPGCPDGTGCSSGADCASGVCDPATMTCAAATCTDTVQNGLETDVDCGGGVCLGCLVGEDCLVGRDCSTGVCGVTLTCSPPSCTDGVLNGAETDIDCGGAICTPCDPFEDCRIGTDCTSGVCASGLCTRPSCSDGVRNGGELGVDCGGPCPACGVPDSVLIMTNGNTTFNVAAAAAARMGVPTVTTVTNSTDFAAQLDARSWDIVVVHISSSGYDSTVRDRAIAHHNAGGRLNWAYWDLDGDSTALTAFGMTATEYTTPQAQYPASGASTDLFNLVETITPPMITSEPEVWADDGDFLSGAGTALMTAGSPTGSVICRGLGGRTLINGWLPENYRVRDGDSDTVVDVVELMVNQFAWQMGVRSPSP